MPNSWSKNFGQLILAQRKMYNLPLRKVAAALDIDTSTLSKIEKGIRPASPRMISVVAELFELDAKEMHIRYLSQKLTDEFGSDPYFKEVLLTIVRQRYSFGVMDEPNNFNDFKSYQNHH